MKKKVLVRAPILSLSGYGENARLVLRALRAYEELFDVYLLAINWGQTSWDHRDNEERRYIDSVLQKTIQHQQQGGQYDISVQVTIPNEWQKMAPVNIGVTAGIETDRISPQWIEKSALMDRIIVISEHAKFGFDSTSYSAHNKQTGEVVEDYRSKTPITVIPYPVRKFDFSEEQTDSLKFETDFNFLCVAQWSPRKNIENTIRWFVEEFIDREVGLILKISSKNNSIMDRTETEKKINNVISKYPNRKCKIYYLHGFMTENEMEALYNHPTVKALISLSHGEGFGLPMFEAAYNGKPIIAPNWGGQVDFLSPEIKNKKTGLVTKKPLFADVDFSVGPIGEDSVWDTVLEKGSNWCYPIQGDTKMKMREVYREYSRFESQAKRLQKIILENYKEEDIYKKYAENISGQSIVSVAVEDLPKVSVVTSVFNALEYLEGLCEDVTRQNIFKEKVEWVLVHPITSPEFEKEKQIILKYKEQYPDNIVYLEKEEDKGLYWAWNEGFKVATGEYFTNWNTDDRRAVTNLEKCAKELFMCPDIGLVYYDQFITNVPNEVFEKNTSNNRKYSFPEFSFETLKMLNLNHAMAFWRKDLHKIAWFEEKYRSAGDWEWALSVASKGVKFKKLSGIWGLYYWSPKGLSTDPKNFSWKRKEEKEVFDKFKDVKIQ